MSTFVLKNKYKMVTFIVLLVYISGVYAAYFQIQRWAKHELNDEDEYQTLFVLSLFSWLIYPLYGLIWLMKKNKKR